VIHLCSMAPDDIRFHHSVYNIGDVDRMAHDAVIDADAGMNMYFEPRLVRPGRPGERGGASSTAAVFAIVGDGDFDTGKTFVPAIPASAVVETSPGNDQSWYFLQHAVSADDARALGCQMRDACGGDHCSGNPTQPYRIPGLPNFPNLKKRERAAARRCRRGCCGRRIEHTRTPNCSRNGNPQTDRAKSYPDHGRQESFLDIGEDTVGAKHERCLLPTLPASTARRGSCRPSITQRPAASRPRSSRRWRDNIRPDAQRNISPAATGCARKLSGATRKLPAASKTDRRVVSHVD
jgi:ribosomal protein L37E